MRATKPIILQIYNILKRHSSPDAPLSQQQIIDYLDEEYAVRCERKAIGRNISYLKEFYEIESCKKGCYLVPEDPPLEDTEIRLLIDSVLGSKHIGKKYSADLIDKLISLGEPGLRAKIKHIHSVNEWSKLDNKDFFFNIDVISEAIDQKKQVKFQYNSINCKKELEKKEIIEGTPYAMLLNNQHYYLVIRTEKYRDVSYLRMDRISDPQICDVPAVPISQNAGFEHGLNYHDLSTCLPYMFSDKQVKVTLRCNKSFIKDLLDWFGDGFTVAKREGDFVTIKVRASEQAMIYWALQYNTNVEVLSPASLREKIFSKLKETLHMYQNT